MSKKEDLDYINKFSKITISKACKYYGYNQSNLQNGKCSDYKIRNVRKFIENELFKMYQEEAENYVK